MNDTISAIKSGNSRSFSFVFGSARASEEIKKAFAKRGLEYIALPPFSALSAPVADHADMLLFDLFGKLLVYGDYLSENKELFGRFDTLPLDYSPQAGYPGDIALNALTMGDKVLCLCEHTEKKILEAYKPVRVAQGYSRCTICKVDEHSLITADPSIALAARDNGLDVVQVTGGPISLPGYANGFIGGCCVRVGDEMLFTGDITAHPDYESIDAFLYNHGCYAVSMTNGILTDLGGFVLI